MKYDESIGSLMELAGEVLSDYSLPELSVADDLFSREQADPFAPQKRKGWGSAPEARCDFRPHPAITYHSFYVVSFWKRSPYGLTLREIKADDMMVPRFASAISAMARKLLGDNLAAGNWALITAPRRRHKERNFGVMIAEQIAFKLGIPFYPDVATARTRQRVGAEFELEYTPPEQNLMVVDDIITTGSTLKALKKLFPGKNMVFFVGINNN